MTTTPSLKQTFLKLVPASLLVQILSFGSSIVLATQLGASTRTDAYYLALSVPLVAYTVLLAGIRWGGIPALTTVAREETHDDFERACSELVTATLVASAIASVIVTAVMIIVLPAAAGGSAQLSSLTRLFMLELMPYAVTGAMLGTLGAILAVTGRFVVATLMLAFEPALKSILVILYREQLGVQALVIGNLVGNLLAVVVLWIVVRRAGIRLTFGDGRRSSVVRSVFKLSAPLVISQAVLQFNPLIDRTTAASLGAGDITELELGLRLFSAPVLLLTAAMIAPLAASWSSRLATDGWEAVTRSFARVVAAVFLITTPVIIAGIAVRHQLVALLYGSHAYTPTAVSRTADVLGMLLLGLVPRILIIPLSTLFVIREDTVFPMKVGIVNCRTKCCAGYCLSWSVRRRRHRVQHHSHPRSLACGTCGRHDVDGAACSFGLYLVALFRPSASPCATIAVLTTLVARAFPGSSRLTHFVVVSATCAIAIAVHGTIMSVGGAWASAWVRLKRLSVRWS